MRVTFLNGQNEMVRMVRKVAVLKCPVISPRVNEMVNRRGRWTRGRGD
jgi:hypothetical protein